MLLSSERRHEFLKELRGHGRVIAVELESLGVAADDDSFYLGRVPRKGLLNTLLGRKVTAPIEVQGWNAGEDMYPLMLAADGLIYLSGSVRHRGREGWPLGERDVNTFHAATSIRQCLRALEVKQDIVNKLKARSES